MPRTEHAGSGKEKEWKKTERKFAQRNGESTDLEEEERTEEGKS